MSMKLQQKIAMALCVFYLITTIGIAVNMHFCSGKLASVKFINEAKCGACKGDNKIKKSHDCCKDTSVKVKVKDSHEAGFKVKLPADFGLVLFTGTIVPKSLQANLVRSFRMWSNKAPPRSAVVALYLYN